MKELIQMGACRMMPEDKFKIISNDYMDLIIKYNGNIGFLKQFEKYSVQVMNPTYAVIYLPVAEIKSNLLIQWGYNSVPKCYALTDDLSLEASGVTKLRATPALNLRGKGVLIGMIDTGIDYTNPVFLNKDGTTRIAAIWDQTIDSGTQYPEMVYPSFYGTEYKREQINSALKNPNPFKIVPSKDENGHGTALAGIAAGSENKENDFSGVVPDTELLVVKLKQTKQNIRGFCSIPANVICYQETDIIWGFHYLIDTARKLKRPLAVCVGLGTSQGAHDNSGPLNLGVTIWGDFPRVAITAAAGNEGNARRHFYSELDPDGSVAVELNVGADEAGFTMELWGDPPMIYTLDILSPNGEYIPAISRSLEESRTIRFVFEETVIRMNYIMVEQDTGKQIILLNFTKPTQGTWKFQVYGKSDLKGSFHVWLPSGNFISKNTYFSDSNSYTTLTSPGNCNVPITAVAYNSNSGTLYADSGKGYSTSNILNPDLAAPGVNIACPALNHGFTTMSGTSVAAAHTTGIAAMMLEWGVVNGNNPTLDTIGIRKFLVRGAQRSKQLQYPNRSWGFGTIDIFNVYNIFRTNT